MESKPSKRRQFGRSNSFKAARGANLSRLATLNSEGGDQQPVEVHLNAHVDLSGTHRGLSEHYASTLDAEETAVVVNPSGDDYGNAAEVVNETSREEWYALDDDDDALEVRLNRLNSGGTTGNFVVHKAKNGTGDCTLSVKMENGNVNHHSISRDPGAGGLTWRLTSDLSPFGSFSTIEELVSVLTSDGEKFFGVQLVVPGNPLNSPVTFTGHAPGELVRNPLFGAGSEFDLSKLTDSVKKAENSTQRSSTITESALQEVISSLSTAQEHERHRAAQLHVAERQYENMYGKLPFDESHVREDAPASSVAQSLVHEIALTKASIESQKNTLVRLKALRAKRDEAYMMLQGELRTLVTDLEKTERELEGHKTSAQQLEHKNKATMDKISTQQELLNSVSSQMTKSSDTLQRQNLNLLKIQGTAKTQVAAMNHEKLTVKQLQQERLKALRSIDLKQAESQQIEAELSDVKRQLKVEYSRLSELATQKKGSALTTKKTSARIVTLEREALAAKSALVSHRNEVQRLQVAERKFSSQLQEGGSVAASISPEHSHIAEDMLHMDFDVTLGALPVSGSNLNSMGFGDSNKHFPHSETGELDAEIRALQLSVEEYRRATAEAYDYVRAPGGGQKQPRSSFDEAVLAAASMCGLPPQKSQSADRSAVNFTAPASDLKLFPNFQMPVNPGRTPIAAEALSRMQRDTVDAYAQLL